MDQLISVAGQKDRALLIDCRWVRCCCFLCWRDRIMCLTVACADALEKCSGKLNFAWNKILQLFPEMCLRDSPQNQYGWPERPHNGPGTVSWDSPPWLCWFYVMQCTQLIHNVNLRDETSPRLLLQKGREGRPTRNACTLHPIRSPWDDGHMAGFTNETKLFDAYLFN